jgi:hypothetical protein
MDHMRVFDAVARLSRRDGGFTCTRAVAAYLDLDPARVEAILGDLCSAGIVSHGAHAHRMVRLGCGDAGGEVESLRERLRRGVEGRMQRLRPVRRGAAGLAVRIGA